MRSAFLFSQIVCVVQFTRFCCAAEGKAPEISPNLVGKTIAWQLHWDRVENPQAQHYSAAKFRVNRKDYTVLVEELRWVVSYNDKDNQPYPTAVNVLSTPFYSENPPPFPKEIRERALAPFKGLPNATVKIPYYTNSFRRISTYSPQIRQKLLACFRKDACSQESLASYADAAGKPLQMVRFGVAPVDVEFPVIMYVVEAVPSVGKIYFDTQAFAVLYSEFNYIGDLEAPWRKAKERLMAAIRAEGDLLEFKNGELTFVKN